MTMSAVKLNNFPAQYKHVQGRSGKIRDPDNMIEHLNYLGRKPECVSFDSQSTFISEAELNKRVKQGEVDPQRDINELDFDDPMRPGIFAGARRFNSSKVHECQLCGWEGHSPSYFAAIDAQGLQAHEQMQTTYEYMVSQISDKFDFLKNYTKKGDCPVEAGKPTSNVWELHRNQVRIASTSGQDPGGIQSTSQWWPAHS